MQNLENKELLLAAIGDYEPYNKSQRKLLSAFVELAVGDEVIMGISSLSKLLGFSRPVIYSNLAVLEKDGIITKMKSNKAKLTEFRIHNTKLNHIVNVFSKKQNFLLKNFTNH